MDLELNQNNEVYARIARVINELKNSEEKSAIPELVQDVRTTYQNQNPHGGSHWLEKLAGYAYFSGQIK
jgi:hypothetical protein